MSESGGGVGYIPGAILDLGWGAVFLFLLAVVVFEAQATYWLGRGAVAGARRTRWHRRFEGPAMDRAHRFMERWGRFAVPVSFLTIGLRSAVQFAAGFARMRFPLYTLAMLPGCLAWAALYTAIALAAVTFAQSVVWWATVLLGAIVAAGIVALVIRRRRSAGSGARTPR